MVLSINELNQLLNQQESSTLDFKSKMYDFTGDPAKANADLVKDVCSMTNTIRKQTSYILFGVESTQGSKAQVIGLNVHIDDAILQDKVKNKVLPRVEFNYYVQTLNGTEVGVMEFPIRRYDSPVVPIVSMRGISPGSVYYRQGSSNTEANGQDAIRINGWMKSLPAPHEFQSKQNELTRILISLQDHHSMLSPIVSELYAIGKKYGLDQIKAFSTLELKGLREKIVKNPEALNYRLLKVFIDIGGEISINLDQYSTNQIRQAFKDEKHLIELDVHLNKTLNEMEKISLDFKENIGKRIATLKSTTHEIVPNFKGKKQFIRIYIFPEDLHNTLGKIRSKAIDLVMKEI